MSVRKLIAGKHSCVGHLSAGGTPGEKLARLEKPALLVYCGEFASMDGPVAVTEEMIDLMITNHNLRIDSLAQQGHSDETRTPKMPPLQLDHSTSARDTVGRVVGRLSKGEYTTEDGKTVPCLLADKIVILGQKSVEHVVDGRWANLSIGADLETGVLNEVSITPFPAAPNATLLSAESEAKKKNEEESAKKYRNRIDEQLAMIAVAPISKSQEPKQCVITLADEEDAVIVAATFEQDPFFKPVKRSKKQVTVGFATVDGVRLSEKGETVKEKLKKHLMEHCKMSDEEADAHMAKVLGHLAKKLAQDEKKAEEHLAAMSEDDAKKLSDDVAEEEKKLAAEKETPKGKEAEEAKAKMAAARPKLIALAKSVKTGLKATHSDSKVIALSARVARLRAMRLLSPAEQKKIDLAAMSKQTDAEVNAYFKAFEDREPVIDARVHGTTKALGLAALSRMTADARKVRLESEARHDLGLPMDEIHKKEMAVSKELPGQSDPADKDEHLSKLSEMLGDHPKKEEVLAHVKALLAGEPAPETPAEHVAESEKKMTALAQNVNKLQTDLQELITLFGETAGITSADLE